MSINVKVMLNAVTTNQSSQAFQPDTRNKTFQGRIAGTGAVSATLAIEGSNDGTNYQTLQSMSLTGTTSDNKKCVDTDAWRFVRATVSAITGTGAAVTCVMGYETINN